MATTERMGVDPLAVWDALADGYLRNEGTEYAFVTCRTDTKPGDGTPVGDAWARAREARAAVAELVEAVEAHNEASDELAASYGPDADRALREKIAARERLDAALARIGGEA